ncbi:PAS domain S-box protein [Virgibacillus sp. C22-A2]|uniref:PAS domain S-box protein n=1 Tax=Virgibacillus tibetensis TaxID=3042313 RepID=A0ABU6KFS1_9BACI|nr:PAS domain S-box protein [Virgibacillus sp. C22-A2]
MNYENVVTSQRVLMEGIQNMLFVIKVDSNFTYEFLNRAAMEGTGLNQDVLGKPIDEVYPDAPATFLYEQYRKAVSSRKVTTYEDSYMSPKGFLSFSETTLTPLFDNKENCTHIVAVVKDITNEKWAESEIKKSKDILLENKQKYQSLYDYNLDAIITIDLNGNITATNLAAESISQFSSAEVTGTSFKSYVIPEHIELVNERFQLAAGGTSQQLRMAITNKSGNKMNIIAKFTPIITNNKVTGIYGIYKDITEQENTLRQLKESEELFRIIAENASDLITLLDKRGQIIYVSPSYKDILGFDNEEYENKHFLHNVYKDDQEMINDGISTAVKDRKPCKLKFRQLNNAGDWIWSELTGTPVYDELNNFNHMVVLTRDITFQKEYEARLRYVAMHDALTGLPNRRFFNEQITKAVDSFNDKKDGLAVLMIDIDYFKTINDTFGHDIGDLVIEEFGKRISGCIRDDDMAARLGGDEFVILLHGVGAKVNATSIAEKVFTCMRDVWNFGGTALEVTTSIGIAVAPLEGTTELQLLKNADLALYEAKESGRNKYKIKG